MPPVDHGPPCPRPMFGTRFSDPYAHYEFGKKLGTGNFAKVILGTCKHDFPQFKLKKGTSVAIKVIKKPAARAHDGQHRMLTTEMDILRSVAHANIVRLYEWYESETKLYLVMEYHSGGELFDRIVEMGRYSEEDARYFTFKLLNAVLYLHDRQICHRDLKPENILLASSDKDAELKISDFGLSKIKSFSMPSDVPDLLMTTQCGTPGYVAPEVLLEKRFYGTSCDMWAVGVIVYVLLCAAPPFFGRTEEEINRRVKGAQYRFPDKFWSHVSDAAKDFIRRLLVVDPARRMKAAEALQHEWIVSIGEHTNDLFALSASLTRARFEEFNSSRRGTIMPGDAVFESLPTVSVGEGGAGVGTRILGAGAKMPGLMPDELLIQEMLALELSEQTTFHKFGCTHGGKGGSLVVTCSHLGFVAKD